MSDAQQNQNHPIPSPQLDFRRETEALVYRQLDRLNGIQSKEQLYDATKSVLESVGVFFKAERVYIYQRFSEERGRHVKYGWRDWVRTNRNLNEENCAHQLLEAYREQLSADENVVICGIDMIKDVHPSLYRPLCVNGVSNWVSVPFFNRGELDGILSVVNPDMEHLDTLAFLLRVIVRLFALHYQSISDMESMERLSATDPLTGLDNRISGGQKVDESLSRGEQGAFMLVDCDNFKQVNEAFGHEVGDRLLIATTRVIRSVFPQGFAMRLGGDEFGVFFPMLDKDRTLFCQWMCSFYYNLNRMKIEGLNGYHSSFSIGAFAYGGGIYKSFDEVYNVARNLCRQAKEYEGNYVMTDFGGFPDLETAFYLLREDRHLYDRLNDDMFSIRDEQTWMQYLDNCAQLKSNMCWRNQRQYEQILNYFKHGNAIEEDYELLYDLVLRFRNSLDAFMAETLVGDILLPYYERLLSSGQGIMPENVLRGHLAKLYLHLGDSLIGIHLMGDNSQAARIPQLFEQCIQVSQNLRPHDPAYEYQIYALCQLVGHYEFFEQQLITPEQSDRYYLMLLEYLDGPKSVTLRDPILLPYYSYLLQNARFYPVLRACQLGKMGNDRTPAESKELLRKLIYIRQHSVDDVLQAGSPREATMRLEKLLQGQLYGKLTPQQLFQSYYKELTLMRNNPKAMFNTADLMRFLILILATLSSLQECGFSPEENRKYVLEGWDLFLNLYKRRKNEATDRQSWYMACYLLMLFIRNKMISYEDKRNCLFRSIGILMLDTYSHSKAMVTYAHVIISQLIEQNPELLVGTLRNTGTVKQVKAHRRQFLDFIETACMVHDIGKLAQIPITSNSYRKLTDHEFRILRMHPTTGRWMLREEPYFDQFCDVIEGHHCSYDGKSGYPANYQFKHPGQRILVDIISICDSLEAATSRIGRNYRVAKPFSQIMDEFYAEAGTRYNPAVLEAIISSRETYNTLKWMVDQNWQNVYRGIFQEIVNGGQSIPTAGANKKAKSRVGVPVVLDREKPSVNVGQTVTVDQLQRIASQQEKHNKWLTQKLVESVESKYEYDQVTKGLHAIFEVMALVKVKDGSIKILQGHPDFLRDFPPTQYHPVNAITEYSVKYVVKPQWVKRMLDFHDYTTLAVRLRGRKSINIELETYMQGWCRFSYCPAEYDESGNLEKALFTCECIDEEVRTLQHLRLVAEYDGLTGLRSRYGGEQLIREALAKRTPGVFAVMDIDHFKSFNDDFGHAVGDMVLAAIGKVLQKGTEYTIIRQGGDEFVAFTESKESMEHHRQRIENLFRMLEGIDIPELEGRKITVSVGAVLYLGEVPTTFDELFRKADRLLYQSKSFEGSSMSVETY